MGHESQIEPWSPKLTTFGFVGFGTDRLRCEEAMKTADSEKPKPRGRLAPQPSTWRGRSEQISLDQVGCEARKAPAGGDVFFLDFSLYRTYRELAAAKCLRLSLLGGREKRVHQKYNSDEQ